MSGRRRGFVEPQPKMRGLCSDDDPELWFPLNEDGIDGETAKAICRRCDLQETCLEGALTNGILFGIYGGFSSNDRRAMLRRRK